MDRSKDQFSFRCIWFARKTSKSPGLSDGWLAAYVDKDGKNVTVVHSNYLETDSKVGASSGIGIGSGSHGYRHAARRPE
ncbi:MAG: hypothetical protein IPG58_15000 [Acidobacteria bacterium]|nr:hypothetical protein [Acidobacteriota bacterium]